MNSKKTISVLCFILLLTTSLILVSSYSVSADESTAKKYAPMLYFEAEEQCYPVDAQYHIDNSYLYSFDGETSTLLDDSPTSTKISSVTEELFYLDNIHGDLRDAESIISNYQQQKNIYDTVVYYRETAQGSKTIIQYWFFYAYNKGELNVHEGDWEMIQIILESENPIKVMYSQHHSGQQTSWDNVETTGSHPHVYVARGSHANYLRSFSGKLGVASDIVGSNGQVLTTTDYTLVELTDQGWLTFAGRWGEVDSIQDTILGFSGPPGPSFREDGQMWNNPIGWGEGLPTLNTALLPIEFLLYHFLTIFVIITIFSIVILCYKLYSRKQKHGLGPRKFSFLYIDGINKHSIGNLLFFLGILIALYGLITPWYSASGSINSGEYTTEGFVNFLLIDGLEGIQITYPGANGPIAMGSFILPFSLLIGIGFVFTIFKSIGIQESKSLGRIYLRRGIGLITPFIILVVVIFTLASIIPSLVPENTVETEMTTLFSALSQNPFGGSQSIPISDSGVTGDINLVWGLGIGGYLLLIAGSVLMVSAGLLIASRRTFY
jgi:hypothetical protein